MTISLSSEFISEWSRDASKLLGDEVRLLRWGPRPIILVRSGRSGREYIARNRKINWEVNLLLSKTIGETYINPSCRAVNWRRLDSVITTGIDVKPTTQTIYCEDLEKALEYGLDGARESREELTQIVMMFDSRKLKPSARRVLVQSSQEDLRSLRSVYQTEGVSRDGEWIIFSRLPADNPRAGGQYEFNYGRWIPEDPMSALLGLMFVGPDLDWIEEEVLQKIA